MSAEQAKMQALSIPGVTGASVSGSQITVYVRDANVSVPGMIGSYTVVKKISGNFNL